MQTSHQNCLECTLWIIIEPLDSPEIEVKHRARSKNINQKSLYIETVHVKFLEKIKLAQSFFSFTTCHGIKITHKLQLFTSMNSVNCKFKVFVENIERTSLVQSEKEHMLIRY